MVNSISASTPDYSGDRKSSDINYSDINSNDVVDVQKISNESREVYDTSSVDPVLTRKMTLINNAIDEIGITPFHWKLFFLNGFGYAVDSLLIVCNSIAQPAVTREFGQPDKKIKGIAMASQIGLLTGAVIWGFSADVIGRKLAFNSSLFICAIFVLVGGAMPNYISFAAMVAIYSAGAGGNYILDATALLEFLPSSWAWLVTFMSVWWAVGYTFTGLLAWAFLVNFSCPTSATVAECTRESNMGWRYLHFTCGALVLVLAVLRLTFVKMVQTPKWLISQNRDEEAVKNLLDIATKYNRPMSLTVEQLQVQGQVLHTEKSVWSSLRIVLHFKGLFQTKKLAWSTIIIIANWFVIGMVTPLYGVFLPYYLETRGADPGKFNDQNTVWRNYAITHIIALFGPVIAGVLVETRYVGRRGTLAVGALLTMILQFGYTQIKTPDQSLAVTSLIGVASNIYYGTIYAYTPEVLPAAHRATGYGVCVAVNRIGGIIGVVIGSYANVQTTAPLFICAALFGLLVILSLALPFEPRGRRSV